MASDALPPPSQAALAWTHTVPDSTPTLLQNPKYTHSRISENMSDNDGRTFIHLKDSHAFRQRFFFSMKENKMH